MREKRPPGSVRLCFSNGNRGGGNTGHRLEGHAARRTAELRGPGAASPPEAASGGRQSRQPPRQHLGPRSFRVTQHTPLGPPSPQLRVGSGGSGSPPPEPSARVCGDLVHSHQNRGTARTPSPERVSCGCHVADSRPRVGREPHDASARRPGGGRGPGQKAEVARGRPTRGRARGAGAGPPCHGGSVTVALAETPTVPRNAEIPWMHLVSQLAQHRRSVARPGSAQSTGLAPGPAVTRRAPVSCHTGHTQAHRHRAPSARRPAAGPTSLSRVRVMKLWPAAGGLRDSVHTPCHPDLLFLGGHRARRPRPSPGWPASQLRPPWLAVSSSLTVVGLF